MAINDDSPFSVVIGGSSRAGGIEVEDGARRCVDGDARVMMWWKYKARQRWLWAQYYKLIKIK